MVCENCGSSNRQDAKFCEYCGSVLKAANAPASNINNESAGYDYRFDSNGGALNEQRQGQYQNSYSGQNQGRYQDPYAAGDRQVYQASYVNQQSQYQVPYQDLYQGQNQYQPPSGNAGMPPVYVPKRRDIKKVIGGALFLIGCCVFTLLLILNIVYIFADSSVADSVYLLTEGALPVTMIQTIYRVMFIIFEIPAMVMALGLWLSFAAGAGKKSERMKTGGLTTIKVMLILQCIWVWVVVLAVVFVAFILAVNSYLLTLLGIKNSRAVVIVVAVLVILLLILIFMFKLSSIKGINCAKILNDGTAPVTFSMFVPVMCFILAAFTAVSAVSSVVMSSGVFAIAVEILQVAMYIIFGLVALKARKVTAAD